VIDCFSDFFIFGLVPCVDSGCASTFSAFRCYYYRYLVSKVNVDFSICILSSLVCRDGDIFGELFSNELGNIVSLIYSGNVVTAIN